MKLRFENILIPVDFSINTDVAIKKAISLSAGSKVSIHFLHVVEPTQATVFSFYQFAKYLVSDRISRITRAQEKLECLKHYFLNANKDAEVFLWVVHGLPIEESIIRKATLLDVDMIVLGKNSHHSILPFLNTVVPSKIARKTGIAVFTVKPGAADHAIRTVVVPVGISFPEKKLAVISELRKAFNIHIRLVSFVRNDRFLPAPLLDAYQFLKENPANNVGYKLLKGKNKGRAILRYCQRINADLLVVYPETETKIGWLNSHMSDALPVQSRTQILAIGPEIDIRKKKN